MKKYILYLALFCAIFTFACSNDDNASTPLPPKEPFIPFQMNQGVNISNWLSQSTLRGEARKNYFIEQEVKNLADFGFDHFRLPVDEEQLFTEEGEKETEAFQLLHTAIQWCEKYNLRIIVDLHILRSHYFNEGETPLLWRDKESQYRYFELWDKLSDELQGYSTELVAYELLNEPIAPYSSQWNSLAAQLIRELRKKEPERKFVLGSNRWQAVDSFEELTVPANDTNIILSFHFYTPHLFTHYKAEWSEYNNLTVPIHYPGEIITAADYEKLSDSDKALVKSEMGTYNKEVLTGFIMQAINRAKELNLQIHCGEFGCYNKTPEEDKINWIKDVVSIFRENDIAYSFWEYKEGFGFCNRNGEVTDRKVLDALTKK